MKNIMIFKKNLNPFHLFLSFSSFVKRHGCVTVCDIVCVPNLGKKKLSISLRQELFLFFLDLKLVEFLSQPCKAHIFKNLNH